MIVLLFGLPIQNAPADSSESKEVTPMSMFANTEEDPCKQSVDLVAGSRCDRRDRDAGATRDGFERGEQGPMPRGRWQPWPEWAHDAHNSVTRRCFKTIPVDRKTFERQRRWAAPATVGPDS